MMRIGDSQTMSLYGKIKNTQVVLLVDTGSTHNFMDQRLVRRLGYLTQLITGIGVSIANGERLWVNQICKKVNWEAVGFQ